MFLELLFLSSFIFSKENTFDSGNQQIALIELFSSEGCSSCPPAERQLYQLKNNKDLWQSFVPINFHVDYWNRLGWYDRFSKEQFTKRQRLYASSWNTGRVYTPAFVINGKDSGSRLALKLPNTTAPQLKIHIDELGNYKANYKGAINKSWTLRIALLGNAFISKVTSGENQGQTLEHNFVALSLSEYNMSYNKKTKAFEATGQINKKITKNKSLSLAAWITEANNMTPIQAVGGDL